MQRLNAGRAAEHLLGALLLLVAVWWLGDAVVALWKFSFGEMFADQFRQYQRLADAGFLDTLLMADNGHRMVLANLLRRVDILHFGGDQTPFVIAGIIAMLAAAAVALSAVWRAPNLPRLARWAALLVVLLGLFWRGSARMQFHGNESFQVYLVILCAAAALLAQARYLTRWHWGWLAVSLGFALLGAFSFATGVAILPALIAMALISRTPWRQLWPSLAVTVLLLVAYLFLLPGGDGVRGTLHFTPMKLLVLVPSWLASAWLWALPGLGDAAVFGIAASDLAQHPATAPIAGQLVPLRAALGQQQADGIALIIGLAGLLALGLAALDSWRRRGFANPLHRLGVGLAVFCAGVAGLVALGRMAYFADNPEQVFADRYVLWSAVFWMGLALAAIGRLATNHRAAMVASLVVLCAATVLWTTQSIGRGWAASASHFIESRAAALQADVYPAGIEPHMDLPDLATVKAHRAALRSAALGPFRSERGRALGRQLALPFAVAGGPSVSLAWREEPAAGGGSLPVLGGVLGAPAERKEVDGVLLLDAQGRVVGLGEFGHAEPSGSWQRLHRNALGFDAFVAGEAGCGPFTLVGVDDALTAVRWLAQVDGCRGGEEAPSMPVPADEAAAPDTSNEEVP